MAREAGIPTRRLSNGGFTLVGRGVWVTRGTAMTYDLRVRAAMLVVPDTAVVSHASALQVHGLWLPTLSDVARQVVHGLPVTTAGQTFLDMASLVDGDELVDSAGAQPERWGWCVRAWTLRRRPGCALPSSGSACRSRRSTSWCVMQAENGWADLSSATGVNGS
jgi:hypothetical protein